MSVTKLASQDIRNESISDNKIDPKNKDGKVSTPSLRTLGKGKLQACAGNDPRLSDDRVALGIRFKDLILKLVGKVYPSPGQQLTAISEDEMEWQTPTTSLVNGNFVDNVKPEGSIDGVNNRFKLPDAPIADSQKVFKNGKRLTPGSDDDYTISDNLIDFNKGSIPQLGDKLLVDYRIP